MNTNDYMSCLLVLLILSKGKTIPCKNLSYRAEENFAKFFQRFFQFIKITANATERIQQ